MVSILDFCDYSTIGATVIMKIPQMLRLLKTQSADGVSLVGLFLELFGYLTVFCYNWVQNYALPTYFEYVFSISQDFLLIAILFQIGGKLDIIRLGGLGLFAAAFYGFTLGIPFPGIMQLLIPLVTPISAFSKVIMLYEVWSMRNADNVSVLSWSIASYTAFARIITNIVKQDTVLTIQVSVAFVLNIGMTLSAMYLQKIRQNKIQVTSKYETKAVKNDPAGDKKIK